MYVLHSAPFHLTADWMHDLSLHGYPALAVTAAKYLYFPALTLVAYGAARISWRFLEYPFIRLKDRFAELPASPRPQGNSRLAAATSTE
jgi:peptidoglycan/LPS O-acetylase OafA/YrhL